MTVRIHEPGDSKYSDLQQNQNQITAQSENVELTGKARLMEEQSNKAETLHFAW